MVPWSVGPASTPVSSCGSAGTVSWPWVPEHGTRKDKIGSGHRNCGRPDHHEPADDRACAAAQRQGRRAVGPVRRRGVFLAWLVFSGRAEPGPAHHLHRSALVPLHRGPESVAQSLRGHGPLRSGESEFSKGWSVGSGNAIRGSRVGAGPMGEAERGEAAPRIRVSFWCANNHETRPSFATDAAVPETWDCPRCGFPAGRDEANPPDPPRSEPYKTHLAYVKERRTDSDGAAILAEALDRIRRV